MVILRRVILFDVKLLFNNNNELSNSRLRVNNGRIIIPFSKQTINGRAIQQLIRIINALEKNYVHSRIPVIIDLGEVTFADKLTMIMFECICFYVIKFYKRIIYLNYRISRNDIWTEGIRSSPLLLLGRHDQEHIEKFTKRFNFDVYSHHFRKLICPSESKLELSKLMTDLEVFLKLFTVEEDCREKISEVIVELVGNAGEHTKTESLLDIDITFPYTNTKTGDDVYGINIVVLNFSNQLFGTALKEKLSSDEMKRISCNSRYHKVLNAFINHKQQFTDWYTEDDFYNIASFQHKISGREGVLLYGGTGLTKLIESLENMSDAHRCYMLSGNRVVNFISEHLVYDRDNWISFNRDNDFLYRIPDNSVVGECPVYLPGTAYNLNFVIKKEKK